MPILPPSILFKDSLFELADTHTSGITPREYSAFLWSIFKKVWPQEVATAGYWRKKPGYWDNKKRRDGWSKYRKNYLSVL